MDHTIAAMSPGERAALINILDRGLASLTKAQRADGTAAASVAQLKQVLANTPNLDSSARAVLAQLAFRPAGLLLHGVQYPVLTHLQQRGQIERLPLDGKWRITRPGWELLWEVGRAQKILIDHYAINPTPGVEA